LWLIPYNEERRPLGRLSSSFCTLAWIRKSRPWKGDLQKSYYVWHFPLAMPYIVWQNIITEAIKLRVRKEVRRLKIRFVIEIKIKKWRFYLSIGR
jgi:hypothetical protein